MGTPRPFRVVLAGALALGAGVGVAACGTSHDASSATTSTVAVRYGDVTTSNGRPSAQQNSPTTAEVTLPAVIYVQTACRSFYSFSGILQHVPEYGADAAGEIGGMVAATREANESSPHWVALQAKFEALESYASSKAWGESAKKVDRTGQYRAVLAACNRIS